MEMKQADLDVLQALYRNGGRATLDELRAQDASGAASTLRRRLHRLVLQGYVVRNNSQYDLTLIGREHFLDELSWREPESPFVANARKRKSYVLTVGIESLDEGGYLATCQELPGCHAEGTTVAEALENLEDAAMAILQVFPQSNRERISGDEYRPGRLLRAELVLPLPA
jgi:predicted RNase H-like HicB family nuclease